MKRTYQPSIFKLKKKFGFRNRLKTKIRLINKRILKKRKLLTRS